MGWNFPWASSLGSEFNFDFHASHTEEQVRDALSILIEEDRAVAAEPTDLAAVARHIGRLSLSAR